MISPINLRELHAEGLLIRRDFYSGYQLFFPFPLLWPSCSTADYPLPAPAPLYSSAILYLCSHYSSTPSSAPPHRVLFIPDAFHPSPSLCTPPHRSLPLAIALYPSPSLCTPSHRSLPLLIALYPSPSPNTPPYRAVPLPIAL